MVDRRIFFLNFIDIANAFRDSISNFQQHENITQ